MLYDHYVYFLHNHFDFNFTHSELFLPMVSVEVTNVIVNIRVCASYRKLYSFVIYVLVI